MPVSFSSVCDLLDECHRLHIAKKPNTRAVSQWFDQHRRCIHAPNSDLSALLSTFLPEKRSDRVYCIKAPTLERLIGKALMLGASRLVELGLYKRPGQGVDLADCVERILAATPNPLYNERHQITVEEVDRVLYGIASEVVWSSPCTRANRTTSTSPRGRDDLQSVYCRLSAREAKWLTRLVLKDYRPVILDSGLIYRCCDPALPLILKVQEDFATAIQTLQTLRSRSATGSAGYLSPHSNNSLAMVEPKIGVKVGRQNWIKGRSIKHCLDLGHGRMSVEHKVDGEYCQFHVSIMNGKLQIQIFSKSGKDSTEDRFKLKGIVAQALGFGRPDCTENKIMPFHKIRNHVARRGRLINVDLDSPPRGYENLMIVFYDILFLDEQSLLGVCHSDRFDMLKRTVRCDKGRAELVKRILVDFHRSTGASDLRKAFASVITAKGEGLVLKPDRPYLDLDSGKGSLSGFCIKLKKEYIGTFGDVGDFAVVGAGFNPTKARCYEIANLAWTVFYVGCLNNKEEVRRWGATPEFTVVGAVEVPESLLRMLIVHGNPASTPVGMNTRTKLYIPKGIEADAPLQFAFQSPPVFDMRCFSFDKPGNTGFWTLRFPAVSKIHFDRDFSDAVTFDELQAMAREARETPDLEDSQENLDWIASLERADPRGRAVDALTQSTAMTMLTTSPPSSPPPLLSPGRSPSRSSPEMSQRQPEGRQSTTSLPTPPTLSLPETERRSTTPEQTTHGNRKRKVVVLQTPPATSPSVKRQNTTPFCPFSTVAVSAKSRKPLQGVDGNASQKPTTSRTSSADTIDARPSAKEAVAEGCERRREPQAATARREKMKPFEHDADVSCTHTTSMSSSGKASQPTTRRQVCALAAEKCHLFGSTVLLAAAALADSAERAALLERHGLAETVLDMDEWFEANRFGATLGRQSRRQILILVDTVQRGRETHEVLAAVELARRELPRKTRGCIAVYDWRVLQHLTVMEDDGVEHKYFDGFQDPWRRWYCGVV
ncbi:hypothetical protein E4U42_006767 [Claviceps africana]|uniref:ATP-dependent DNA ligase family profile domain-containing protein n=1 Tax=Claviceps africana TaxID=83212 RepID=A0A8K0J3Y6_9HYPO|nr:hypothetical protein E4U42_006767 [Claviceps africana]